MRKYPIKLLCLILIVLFAVAGCQFIPPEITKKINKFTKPNIKEAGGIEYEVKSCTLSSARVVLCRLTITSKYRDRGLTLTPEVEIQDDAGNSYSVTAIGFGKDKAGLHRNTMLIADTPYDAILEVENVSTQATKVRAIHLKRVDDQDAMRSYINLVFTRPPMVQ